MSFKEIYGGMRFSPSAPDRNENKRKPINSIIMHCLKSRILRKSRVGVFMFIDHATKVELSITLRRVVYTGVLT